MSDVVRMIEKWTEPDSLVDERSSLPTREDVGFALAIVFFIGVVVGAVAAAMMGWAWFA